MRWLGAACIVAVLSLTSALATSVEEEMFEDLIMRAENSAMWPGEAFKKIVEGKLLEECLAQPDDACVFELTVTAARESLHADRSLKDVASAQARGGFFKRALSAASRVALGSNRPEVLADIVVEQARAGLVEDALETIDEVRRDPLWYIRSLCAIASAQARSGDEDAKKNLTAAIAIAEQSHHNSELYYASGPAWYFIVEARLDVDGLVGAQESLASLMRAGPYYTPWAIRALSDIAMAQASAGLESQALETFFEARRLTTEKDNAIYLPLVAVAQTNAGYVSHAAKSFHEAVETARRVQDIWSRIDFLSEVSQAQREAGLHENADATANIAVEAARARVDELSKMSDGGLRIARALRNLAYVQTLAGRISEAENTVDRIHGFSQFYYAWAMADLAVAQWEDGRGSDAVATIDAAQESARKIDSRLGWSGQRHGYAIEKHWYRIAVAKATVGDVRGALRVGEQHKGDTRFHIFQGVAELMAKG